MEKPGLDYLRTRISVDVRLGLVSWIDATKHHRPLNGGQAGSVGKNTSTEKCYWRIKINGLAIKRSHIVFLFANGRWPELQIDHINGNSLDDRIENLREATPTQNAWNHKAKAKKSDLPMGVRALPSGRFQVRITCNKVVHHIGPFDSLDLAQSAYQQKRKEMFGAYS